ncbi:hypothetical protein BJ742DRAFT_1584 [Cladochytrium replicatum]|nr:hypothetical protein BJ742DRAFT_1584 [Cladochytrium replicatum]
MGAAPNDYPAWRSAFAKDKIGAAGLVIYSAFDFVILMLACTQPIYTSSNLTGSTTLCDLASQAGILYLVILELIFVSLFFIGHLTSIILSVFVLRWRMQWLDYYAYKTPNTPVHPGRGFMLFSLSAVVNVMLLMVFAVYLLAMRSFRVGGAFAAVAIFGGLYIIHLGRQIWSLVSS